MFYFIFILCCKDTTKSNNYQIFKGKSYYIVYYLTFLNRKIKYYYLFTYYLLYYYYYILYVSYYIIYLIIYRERTKANGKGRAAPRRSAILPASSSSSSPPSGGEGREEQTSKQNRKRENQGERCRRHLRPFLDSLLFCLLSSPSTPSPAAHRFATTSHQQPGREEGRPPRPLLPSCPLRPLPRLLPLPQVVRVGQRASQGGDPLPLTPSTLSTLPGCFRIYADTSGGRRGGRVDISGRRGCWATSFVSGFFAQLYRSKYQLFIFSAGMCRAQASAVEVGNCT